MIISWIQSSSSCHYPCTWILPPQHIITNSPVLDADSCSSLRIAMLTSLWPMLSAWSSSSPLCLVAVMDGPWGVGLGGLFQGVNLTRPAKRNINTFMKYIMMGILSPQFNIRPVQTEDLFPRHIFGMWHCLHCMDKPRRWSFKRSMQLCTETAGRLRSALPSHRAFPWRGSPRMPWNPAVCFLCVTLLGFLASPLITWSIRSVKIRQRLYTRPE